MTDNFNLPPGNRIDLLSRLKKLKARRKISKTPLDISTHFNNGAAKAFTNDLAPQNAVLASSIQMPKVPSIFEVFEKQRIDKIEVDFGNQFVDKEALIKSLEEAQQSLKYNLIRSKTLIIKNADFRGLNLYNFKLPQLFEGRVIFENCDFSDSYLEKASFAKRFEDDYTEESSIEFNSCKFNRAVMNFFSAANSTFEDCDFSLAQLSNSGFGYSNFKNCSFDFATMSQAYMTFCVFKDSSFIAADLSSAHLEESDMRGSDFRFANLLGLSIRDPSKFMGDLSFSNNEYWANQKLDAHLQTFARDLDRYGYYEFTSRNIMKNFSAMMAGSPSNSAVEFDYEQISPENSSSYAHLQRRLEHVTNLADNLELELKKYRVDDSSDEISDPDTYIQKNEELGRLEDDIKVLEERMGHERSRIAWLREEVKKMNERAAKLREIMLQPIKEKDEANKEITKAMTFNIEGANFYGAKTQVIDPKNNFFKFDPLKIEEMGGVFEEGEAIVKDFSLKTPPRREINKSRFIDLLKEIKAKGLPKLLKDLDLRNIDFRGIEIPEGFTFRNVNFSGADFSEQKLKELSFISCDFKNSSFEKALIQNLYFDPNTKLENVDFRDAVFEKVGFAYCSLIGANFENADFSKLVKTSVSSRESLVNFYRANLRAANFKNAKINSCTNFTAANLKGADLSWDLWSGLNEDKGFLSWIIFTPAFSNALIQDVKGLSDEPLNMEESMKAFADAFLLNSKGEKLAFCLEKIETLCDFFKASSNPVFKRIKDVVNQYYDSENYIEFVNSIKILIDDNADEEFKEKAKSLLANKKYSIPISLIEPFRFYMNYIFQVLDLPRTHYSDEISWMEVLDFGDEDSLKNLLRRTIMEGSKNEMYKKFTFDAKPSKGLGWLDDKMPKPEGPYTFFEESDYFSKYGEASGYSLSHLQLKDFPEGSEIKGLAA